MAAPKIFFRADASRDIGSGHVMRCMVLAAELRRRGADTRFICREAPGNLIALLRENNFPVETLPATIDEHEDAVLTARAMGADAADWLVVDHYGLSRAWEQAVRKATRKILAIDDIARAHDCDALLDQNFSGDAPDRYRGLVPDPCALMLGPRYALLQPDYADTPARDRDAADAVRRVLVFFGGADAGNMTGEALEALSAPELRDLHADVVVGAANIHADELERRAAARPHTTLHRARRSLADLMRAADLAVGAGGTTTWERFCAGLPAVVVSIADNQVPASRALGTAGYIRYLGDADHVRAADLTAALADLRKDGAARAQMAERGRVLVDGRGAARVAELLAPTPSDALNLRSATTADRAFLYQVANDPAVRAQSFSTAPIPWDNHVAWFAGKIADTNARIYILEAGALPVGFIRFDLKDGAATLSYALDAPARGRKWGTLLVERSLRVLAAEWSGEIHAAVKRSNAASCRVFEKLGFHATDTTGADQVLYVKRLSER